MVGAGSRATPVPDFTPSLMFSILSNSAAVRTETPRSRRKRSTSRRMTSPLTKRDVADAFQVGGGDDGPHAASGRTSGLGQHHFFLPPRLEPSARAAGAGNDTRPRSAAPSWSRSVDLIGVKVFDVDARGVFALEAAPGRTCSCRRGRPSRWPRPGRSPRPAQRGRLRMADSSSRYLLDQLLAPLVVGLSEGRRLSQRPREPADQGLDPGVAFRAGGRLRLAAGCERPVVRRRPRNAAAAGHVAKDFQPLPPQGVGGDIPRVSMASGTSGEVGCGSRIMGCILSIGFFNIKMQGWQENIIQAAGRDGAANARPG